MIRNIQNVKLNTSSLILISANGQELEYNYLWLRDNCPTAFHPQTKERNFDLLSVSDDIKITDYKLDENSLWVKWSEQDHQSQYDLRWLEKHAYKDNEADFLMMPNPFIWQSDMRPARFDYQQLISNDNHLFVWLSSIATHGLTIVENMPQNDTAMERVAESIGHLRRTNFGLTFDVHSKPNPNNQAYTSESLPLHTDLPNQETPPGYQFLHCLHNDAEGGESIFIDGFSIATQIRQQYPKYFKLLSQYKIPFRFHDETCDIRELRPIICIVDNEINEIIFNAHIADTFNLPPEIIQDYYLAYRTFIKLLNDPTYLINFKLIGGEMVVFDNRRVLHGRGSFDPQTGSRHLRGCYVDKTEFKSKYRKLKQKFTEST